MTTPSANDSLGPGGRQHRVGITRREAMQIGYSGLLGVSLTSALPARATAQDPPLKGSVKPEADRLTRSPRQVAEQLAAVYGNRLEQVAYIPALPLVAKLRLSELTGEPKYAEEVNTIVAPFLRGDKSPVPEIRQRTGGPPGLRGAGAASEGEGPRTLDRSCRAAADQIFGKDGKPLPVMPFHSEMSDAVFMAGPILAATGKLTGERKYFDAAVTHFASMRKLVPAPRRPLPAFAAVRGRLGSRQRLPGARPGVRPERLARRPSRAEGAARRVPEAHGRPQASSGRQDRAAGTR